MQIYQQHSLTLYSKAFKLSYGTKHLFKIPETIYIILIGIIF